MGVSSLSMKDKTMLCRNGADVKPFGTSCSAPFPLKSGWGDLLKVLPSCACLRVLWMMRKNEDILRKHEKALLNRKDYSEKKPDFPCL